MNYSDVEIVSLFDGIAGFPLAWCRVTGQDPKNFHYLSSEIEKFPIAVAGKNFPKREELGDVTRVRFNPDNASFELFQPSTQRPVPPTGGGTAPTNDHSHTTGDGDDSVPSRGESEVPTIHDSGTEPGITSENGRHRSPNHHGDGHEGSATNRHEECDADDGAVRDEPTGTGGGGCGRPGPDPVNDREFRAGGSGSRRRIICFGSPCQGLSTAGRQRGLEDERSGLFHEAIRICGDARPDYCVWENVAGAFSSNDGEDFAEVLRCFANIGYCQTHTTLDAQWFGVPQRRRRVFLVAVRDGIPEGADIFDIGGRSRESTRQAIQLIRQGRKGNHQQSEGPGEGTPAAAQGGTRTFDRKQFGGYGTENVASTVSARDYKDATDLVEQTYWDGGQVSSTLTTTHLQQRSPEKNKLPCVIRRNEPASPSIRRITPLETLRLQGFPDDWFDGVEGYNNTAAYKATGNSVAVPCVEWVFERIIEFDKQQRGKK